MNDKELKKIWKDASRNDRIQLNHQKILNDMNTANQKLDNQIKWRNIRETGAAIFVIVVFSIFFLFAKNSLIKIGAATVVLAAIYIIYKLYKVRSKKHINGIALSIKEQLVHRLNYLKQERALLKNILYWYILPLLLPLAILIIGIYGFTFSAFIHLFIAVVIGYGIQKLNIEGAKAFDRNIEQLEKAIQQLEQE